MERSTPGRRRPQACDPCRKRKLRCDRNFPCAPCLRSRREECSYQAGRPPPGSAAAPSASVAASGTSLASGTTKSPLHDQTTDTASTLQASLTGHGRGSSSHSPRSSGTPFAANSSEPEGPSSTAATGTWHNSTLGSVLISGQSPDSSSEGARSAIVTSSATLAVRSGKTQSPTEEAEGIDPSDDKWLLSLTGLKNPIKGVLLKGRYLGQSHWLHALMLTPTTLVWVHEGPAKSGTELWRRGQECKALGRQIKAQSRPQAWVSECGKHLPPRSVCDKLLELYVENFESVHRIVHVPTLMAEYERHWWNPLATDTFIVHKIQLCLALGSYLYDDTFSLRPTVEQWIQEAKSTMVMIEKAPSNLLGMQVLCLLYLTRSYYKGKWGPVVWCSAGTVHQAAIHMGLHIDPSNLANQTPLEAEMRRRLWKTVLEIQLQACLDAGTPCVVSLDIGNCEEPANLNDDQLDAGLREAPTAHAPETFTNTSLQILFGRSIELRLKIVNLVNNQQSHATYGDVLRLTSDLEEATRVITSQLNSYVPALSNFRKRWSELLFRQYFIALHVPYMLLAMNNPLYYFSRKVCVDNATRLYHTFVSPRDEEETLRVLRSAASIEASCDEFIRFTTSAVTYMHSLHMRCRSIIAAELRSLIQDTGVDKRRTTPIDTVLAGGTGNLQISLLNALLRASVKCAENRLRARHIDIKDLTVATVNVAGIEALMSGLPPAAHVNKRALGSYDLSISIMQEHLIGDVSLDDIVMDAPELSQGTGMGSMGTFWLDAFQDITWDDLAPRIPQP